MLAAAGMGLVLLSAVSLTPLNGASAATVNFGNRNVPGPAIAGGARFATVSQFYPQGKAVKTRAGDGKCSMGVPWRLANGTRGFLTAGHCLSDRNGAQILKSPLGATNWTLGAPIGIRSPKNGTTYGPKGTLPGTTGDIAFVASSLPIYNQVFVGGPGSTSRLRITSWTSRGGTPGDRLCFSGYASGSVCGLQVGTDKSYRSGNALVTGIAEAYQTWGSNCPTGGDSGGTVFRMQPNGNTVVAVGIVSGSGFSWGGINGCSLYYTPLSAAVSRFGGGPITS